MSVHVHRPDPDDPAAGLAPERTGLAWDRSGLAVVACAVVLLRRVWPLDSPGRLLAGAAIAVGIALWLAVLLVKSHRAGAAVRAPSIDFRRMLVATLLFAAAAFTISLFPPG